MPKPAGLPKYYNVFKDKSGKERLQYQCKINGKRHTLSCKYDPREDQDKAYEEVQAWKYRIMNPEEDTRLKLPSDITDFTLQSTFAFALDKYVLNYMIVRKRSSTGSISFSAPSPDTRRVALDNVNLIKTCKLGSVLLKKLTEKDIQEFLKELANTKTYTRGGNVFHYGPNTCSKCYYLILGFMRRMGWDKILMSNTTKQMPPNDSDTYHTKSDIPDKCYLNKEEKERFIAALFATYSNGRRIAGVDTSDAVYVMLDGALRPGEVRALQKQDFSVTDNSIFVQHSIPKGQRSTVKSTKTNNKAKVFLCDKSVEIIEEHVKSCTAEDDFIFKSRHRDNQYAINPNRRRHHMPLSHQSIYNCVKNVARRAKINDKSVYPYLARHTTLNEICNEDGPEIAQAVARHSDPRTTLANYVHAGEKQAREARDRRNQQQAI